MRGLFRDKSSAIIKTLKYASENDKRFWRGRGVGRENLKKNQYYSSLKQMLPEFLNLAMTALVKNFTQDYEHWKASHSQFYTGEGG